jgi:hypothetical protein
MNNIVSLVVAIRNLYTIGWYNATYHKRNGYVYSLVYCPDGHLHNIGVSQAQAILTGEVSPDTKLDSQQLVVVS